MAMTPAILRLTFREALDASSERVVAYAGLRAELWPASDASAHALDLVELLSGRDPYAGFLAMATQWGELASESASTSDSALYSESAPASEARHPVGFAEASLRALGANGCETRPVAFLEGLYVSPACRRRGVARALVREVEHWARSLGCTELGSDALLGNDAGHAAHRALGFEEAERVVCFRRRLL
jgi:aminoglycoside 6'-N-acetyltransferase I